MHTNPNEPRQKQRRTALVLGGGGAFGVVQAAYIQAAFERGFRPDIVIGTSVGSLNGAWVAMYPDQPEGLLEIWRGLGAMKVLRLSPVRLARQVVRRPRAVCANDLVPFLLKAHIGGRAFEQTELDFAVIATNLSRGTKHVFTSGSIGTAIAASTAIPGVFEPVELDGELFVDGCLTASVDLATAIDMGATDILAIDLNPAGTGGAPRTALGVLLQSFRILIHSSTDAMEAIAGRQANVHVMRPDLTHLSPWRLEVGAEQIAGHLRAARIAILDAVDTNGHVIPRLVPHHMPTFEAARALVGAATAPTAARRRLRLPYTGWPRRANRSIPATT